jgi:hypothetical protein
MGILGAYGSYHVGPESAFRSDRIFPKIGGNVFSTLSQDSDYCHGTLFAKFNNGRFFFNAEAAWLYWTDRLMGPTVFTSTFIPGLGDLPIPGLLPTKQGTLSLLPTPRYTEQWRFMVETGLFAGPAKLSLLSAWTPGPDRRNGTLIDRQSAAFVWHPTYDSFLGNFDVFRPYSFVFAYNYGSGFNAYNLSLDGYVRDAWVLAARLDYAVAANLNVYGTFLWAERTSHGYGWACIAPHDNQPIDSLPIQFSGQSPTPAGNVLFALNGAPATSHGPASPNIPETALGWEVDAGVDWQFLEGWTVGFLAGYWQPGKWFNFACIDRSVVQWSNLFPSAANFWGTRPDRNIDPILAGQVTMTFSF